MINSYVTVERPPLGCHSCVSVRLASGQDSSSEEPGRLAVPQLRKRRTCSVARHDRCFVTGYLRKVGKFTYQIPRFIWNNVLCFISWYVGNMPCASLTKAFKFQELCRPSLGALSRVCIRVFLQTLRL